MAGRQRVQSASPYEEGVGYCRAVRVGDWIAVSGTAPIEDDGRSTAGDAGVQAARCLTLIDRALGELGATMADVVRTRLFITDPADADAVGAAHGRMFGAVRPAATMVVVAALLRPEWRVEIEADAIVEEDR